MNSKDNPNKCNTSKYELFENALYDVEHAMGMYASSYCTVPAEVIYDKEALSPLMDVIKSCHIYIIGFLPVLEFIKAQQREKHLSLLFSIQGNEYTIEIDIPDEHTLKQEGELFYLQKDSGERGWIDELFILSQLSEQSNALSFEVKYIGQAYGKDGSRNAIDRLLKHETLQKIALKGVPKGYRLSLLLLEVQPSNQLVTVFNPFAKNTDDCSTRIKSGLDKLFNTTEQERIALYEASLIRYFSPQYNKEFKNSFPSTNLKILQDCYDKDFSAVIAEICIDELPFKLFSETVKVCDYHIAKHDLHKDQSRKIFFSI